MNAKNQTSSAAKSRDFVRPAFDEQNVPVAWRPCFRRLLALREQLVNETDQLEHEAQDATLSFSPHMADAATDSFDRDLALSLLSLEQNAVGEIDAALQRIRDGRYGVCEFTGKAIPRQRLEAIPWTRYTVEAQAEMERTGGDSRVHLNSLQSVNPEKLMSQ